MTEDLAIFDSFNSILIVYLALTHQALYCRRLRRLKPDHLFAHIQLKLEAIEKSNFLYKAASK